MAFTGHHVTYRYNPNQLNDRGIADDWIVDHRDVDSPSSRIYDTPTSSLMPMRRYIDEADCPLFIAATQPDTATLPSFQSLDIAPYAYPTTTAWPYNFAPDAASPSLSGPSSSYFSSCASDRQPTPASPPDSGFVTWSPEIVHADHVGFNYGGGYEFSREQKPVMGHPCVAMHEIQSYEDPQPEKYSYDDDHTAYYGSYPAAPHEGYQPIEPHGEVADSGVEDNDSKDEDYTPRSPNLRRRRPQPTRSVTSPRMPSKVTKRSGHIRRSSAPQPRPSTNGSSDNHSTIASNRAFPCALANYGCSSTFGSKNEWKRHVNTQHMRLAYWRCDQCEGNRKPNDFNRKDLFIQHVRRMHSVDITTTPKKSTKQTSNSKPTKGSAEDQAFNTLAERCFKQDRSPPDYSGCHFCDTTFNAAGDSAQTLWDKRLEHVAQHMESAKKHDAGPANPGSWRADARLERWLLDNRIIKNAAEGLVLA